MTMDPTTTDLHAKNMARIEPIDPSRATGKARELLDEFAERGGGVQSTPTARSAV